MYTNEVPFENPVIPEVLTKNVDEVVDNSHIVWRDGGQLPARLTSKIREETSLWYDVASNVYVYVYKF